MDPQFCIAYTRLSRKQRHDVVKVTCGSTYVSSYSRLMSARTPPGLHGKQIIFHGQMKHNTGQDKYLTRTSERGGFRTLTTMINYLFRDKWE